MCESDFLNNMLEEKTSDDTVCCASGYYAA